NRETRAPLVAELLPHQAELDPKYHYLLDAPRQDPQGNPAVIRFSRKTREQYVQSEEGGKPTGWRAFFKNGKWVEETSGGAKAGAKPAGRSSGATRQRRIA